MRNKKMDQTIISLMEFASAEETNYIDLSRCAFEEIKSKELANKYIELATINSRLFNSLSAWVLDIVKCQSEVDEILNGLTKED